MGAGGGSQTDRTAADRGAASAESVSAGCGARRTRRAQKAVATTAHPDGGSESPPRKTPRGGGCATWYRCRSHCVHGGNRGGKRNDQKRERGWTFPPQTRHGRHIRCVSVCVSVCVCEWLTGDWLDIDQPTSRPADRADTEAMEEQEYQGATRRPYLPRPRDDSFQSPSSPVLNAAEEPPECQTHVAQRGRVSGCTETGTGTETGDGDGDGDQGLHTHTSHITSPPGPRWRCIPTEPASEQLLEWEMHAICPPPPCVDRGVDPVCSTQIERSYSRVHRVLTYSA